MDYNTNYIYIWTIIQCLAHRQISKVCQNSIVIVLFHYLYYHCTHWSNATQRQKIKKFLVSSKD